MNFNVKNDKVDQNVVFLIKKDPYKPFGDFAIEVISTSLKDYEAQYHSNNLMFSQSVRPLVLEIHKSATRDKNGVKPRPQDTNTASETKETQDETSNTDPSESQGMADADPAVQDRPSQS